MKTEFTFLIFISIQCCLLAQDPPTCEEASSATNQQWEPLPALQTVLLNSTNGYLGIYKFPIVKDRQYFKIEDASICGSNSIAYTIFQKSFSDPCSGLEVMDNGVLMCSPAVKEFYVDNFNEAGGFDGYITFNLNFNTTATVDFAVMYGEPATPVQNNIVIQDFDGTVQEEVSTAGMPEDSNVPGCGAWFNFSTGAADTALYLKYSAPIPAYTAGAAIYDADNNLVNEATQPFDFYAGECVINHTFYLLAPGTAYKIFVSSALNSPPGFLNISLHRPPTDSPNDRMVNAINVSPSVFGACNFVHGKIKRASTSPQSTVCTNLYSGVFPYAEDIWYKFTATQPTYYFSIKNITDHQGLLENIKMSVLNSDGTSTVGSSCQQFFPSGATEVLSVIQDLTPGNQYLLRLAGWDGINNCSTIDAEFDFCLARPECITNDDCATAAPFAVPQPGQDATLAGSTLCATLSSSGDCNAGPQQDAWWSFTATQTSYDLTLTAFDGVFTDNGGIQIEITSDCNGATVPGSCHLILLNQMKSVGSLSIGQTYYLRIRGGLSEGLFSLLVHAPDVLVEDECSSISILPVGASCDFTTISTVNASGTSLNTCGYGDNDDVWYNFTAPTQVVKFTVANFTSVQGIVNSMYGGIYDACNGTLLNCFELNDGNNNRVVTNLSIGQSYKLQLFSGGFDNRGTFDLCLQSVAAVANDICANAIPVVPPLYSVTNPMPIAVNTLGAATGSNDCDGNPADDELWYSFSATANSAFLFKATDFMVNSGTSFNPAARLELFDACAGTSIQCLYLNLELGRVVTFADAGTYKYRVWTEGNTYTASFNLLHLRLPDPPANDYCNTPTPVTVAAFDDPCNTVAGSTLGGTYSDNFECGFNWWDDVYFSFTATYANIAVTVDNFSQGYKAGIFANLYPNPVAESLTLFAFFPSEKHCSLRIMDMAGRMACSEDLSLVVGNFEKKLDVTGLQAGMYFMEIKSESKLQVLKFVKI